MSESFSLEWAGRVMRGDAEAASWYACTPDHSAGHARRRARSRPPALDAAEAAEWRAFLAPHAPPPEVTGNLSRIAAGEALVVATGQQAGLFGGPLFTLYKAAGAILWARDIERQTEIPCVPLFWVASDDHDFTEVARHAWLDGSGALREWTAPVQPNADGRPVFDYSLSGDEVRAFAQTFGDSIPPGAFADDVRRELDALAAAAPVSWEFQFVRLLLRWFGGAGLVPVVPRLDWIRRRATELLRRETGQPGEATRRLIEAGARLRRLGATDGIVHRAGGEANFFVLRDGLRTKVTWEAGLWMLRHPRSGDEVAAWTPDDMAAEIAARPGIFSPNAALRPIVQDAVFPTVLYVAGPAEMVYHAQIGGLYELFGVFRPGVVARPRAMLIEPRVRRIAEKLGLPLDECLSLGAEYVRREAARGADEAGLRERLLADAAEVGRSIARLEETVFRATGDTALRAAAAKLREGFEKGSEKLMQRTDALLERRHADAVGQAARLATALWPGGEPQERVLGALAPLVRTAGMGAPMRLLDLLNARRADVQAIDTATLAGEEETKKAEAT